MRKRWLMVTCLLLVSLLFTACGADTEESAELPAPSAKEVLVLLNDATELDKSIYDQDGLTTAQLYDFYKPYFTKSYVDEVIIPGGNLMQNDGKWVVAFQDTEPLEGTVIIPPLDEAEVRVTPRDVDGEVNVRYEVPEELYPAHTQKLTLVFKDGSWKVNSLEW